MPPKINMIGIRCGRLLVLEESLVKSCSGEIRWACLCDCGNKINARGASLRSGETVSCGCYRAEIFNKRVTKHGKINTPTYKTWNMMLQRCLNTQYDKYSSYGGRGITVCDRWNPRVGGSFENFLEDMGERPQGLTLDRINNNSGYFPENCRWTNNSEQGYNQRRKRTNTSGVTGVYWCSTRKKWKAEIKLNGQKITLGSFVLFDAAVGARKQAELKYYGYNKIEDPEDAA